MIITEPPNIAQHSQECSQHSISPPLSEARDDYPRIIARLNPDWRVILCKHGIQWIVQKRQGGAQWRGVSFHRTRDILMRDARKAGSIDPDAWETLAALPANMDTSGKPVFFRSVGR